MAGKQLRAVVGQLRRLLGRDGGCTLTDSHLLDDFVNRKDEAAFEVLVWRHSTMVLSLCERILHDSHDAEDAFQATFLVFARKAGSIGKGEAVGSWLYKVAYRVALRLRAKTTRSGNPEPIDDLPAPDGGDEALWSDLRPVLDQEIDRLPEKYRAPFVLCYLQGHTNEEAAEQLGCPKGTVLSRLARGRERLRSRLVRRGVTLSVGGLAAALSQHAASAAVPPPLVNLTIKAAIPFAAGQAASGLVSASVAALTEGALHAMFMSKMKQLTAALVVVALLGTTGTFARWALAEAPRDGGGAPTADRPRGDGVPDRGRGDVVPAADPARTEVAAADRERAPADDKQISGHVVAADKDGKSITIQVPRRGRDEAANVIIQLNDKTTVIYQSVGVNGAKPTEGYHVYAQLSDNKEVATLIRFSGAEGSRRGQDVGGKVVAVAKDGKSITLEPRQAPRRGEETTKVEVRFNDKTVLAFHGVGKDGAKMTEGLIANVSLEDGSKETAAIVDFYGDAPGRRRDEKGPDITGKVVAAAKDGSAVTLEQPPANRGDEPVKIEIKLNAKTTIGFNNVIIGGASIEAGQQAQIWLADGSKDTAARAGFTSTIPERYTTVTGKVVAVAKDGSSVTLEQPSQERGEDVKRVEVKITVNTRVSFSEVGPNEAKIVEGLVARARMIDGSADTAAQIGFGKPGVGRR